MAKKKWLMLSLALIIALVTALAGCSNNKSSDSNSGSNTGGTTTSGTSQNSQTDSSSGSGDASGDPKYGGTLKIAIAGEPPTLDQHVSTAYLVSQIGWHIFEGLFTLDANYRPTPMLAKDYSYDDATKTYTIHLREEVTFHNGKPLTADDVIASLERWGVKANYGRILFENVKELKKTDDHTIEFVLNEPSPILPILLAYPNQQSAIYPKEVVEAAGDGEITEFIGTGPFRFVEHKPDQYIKLARYEDYKPLDKWADGMGGSRIAYLDELMFIPTPEVSVRLDGVQTGQFDFADQINSDMYETVKANSELQPLIIKPYWWTQAVFNKKQGVFADKRMRQAVALALDMEPIMQAAFASDEFYRLDPSIMFQEQTQFWSDAGSKDVYNVGNVEKAKQLVQEAGYNGETIRWLTTKEYDFMYKNTIVAAEQLKERLGMNFDLQVVDYATIVTQRNDPNAYEIFIGATTFTPDPGIWPVFDSNWGGWWVDPVKDELLKKVNTEMDPIKRKQNWDELQAHFWEEVPLIKFGDFFVLSAARNNVHGVQSTPFPFYWNVWKD